MQGYKFNVFYPDLIDRKIAPEFTIEKDPEADEFGSTCVLRFHAGPPYEVNFLKLCWAVLYGQNHGFGICKLLL